MDYKSFDTLNDTFNIDNDIEDMENTVEEIKPDSKKKKNQKYTLEDLAYLKTELQDRIENNRIVANELAQTLKVGAPPRLFEVYAKLSSTISDDIMHLADIARQITDYQVIETKEKMRQQEFELKQQQMQKRIENGSKPNSGPTNLTQIQNNTYNISSKDLLDKVLEEVEDEDCITDINQLPKFDYS